MHNVEVQGVSIPALGFGTWKLTGKDCEESVADALEIGYRHIDTARMYENETEVGRGMTASGVPREDVFLVTKIWPQDFAKDRARKAAEDSLRQLNVDYVDLLLLHWPSSDTPLAETLGVLAALREEGKIRHAGVSNFPNHLLDESLEIMPILTNQIEYHPYTDRAAVVEHCQARDVMITAYTPLARGAVDKDPVIRRIAERYGKTPAQVTLRWLIQQDKVSTIPKAATPDRRRENLDIGDFTLDDEEMAAINRPRNA